MAKDDKKSGDKKQSSSKRSGADPSKINKGKPSGRVATPTGPTPVSALARNEDEAKELLKKQKESEETPRGDDGEPLSEDEVESMPASELHAVAVQRGYDLGNTRGARISRQRFLAEQKAAKKG